MSATTSKSMGRSVSKRQNQPVWRIEIEKVFQENHARDGGETEQLRRICCEEANRARQARIEELSMQQQSWGLRNTSTQGSKNRSLKARPSISPLSRTICHSSHCLEQLYPDITQFSWSAVWRHANKEGVFTPCNLWPWLYTDCRSVIKHSVVSVGECNSMSRRSRSVKPAMTSRALARPPDATLSSGFQIRSANVLGRELSITFFFFARVNWFISTPLRCGTCHALGETVKNALP